MYTCLYVYMYIRVYVYIHIYIYGHGSLSIFFRTFEKKVAWPGPAQPGLAPPLGGPLWLWPGSARAGPGRALAGPCPATSFPPYLCLKWHTLSPFYCFWASVLLKRNWIAMAWLGLFLARPWLWTILFVPGAGPTQPDPRQARPGPSFCFPPYLWLLLCDPQ